MVFALNMIENIETNLTKAKYSEDSSVQTVNLCNCKAT